MNDGQQISTVSFDWQVLESFEVPGLGPFGLVLLVLILAAAPVWRSFHVR